MNSESRPVVLVIENAVAVTGSVKAALRSSSILRNDFEFLFVLPVNSQAKTIVEKEGFAVCEIPFLEISKSWKSLFYIPMLIFNLLAFRKIISDSKAKLIVANDFYNMLPSLYKLLGGQIPYVTYVRFIPSRFPSALVKIWCFFHYRLAASIIPVSGRVRKDLKSMPKVKLVYSELPTEKGYQFYLYDLKSKTILYLSNYIPGKGLEYAIHSFSSLQKDLSEWKLRFVGSDMGLAKNKEYKKRLLALSHDLQVSDHIEWFDFAEDVVKEYRQAAVVLNFSDSESFSLTCMEAMFIGRPVIATKCGGPEEMISSGVDGELVEVRGQDQMNAALKKLIANPDLRQEYGERAHKSVSLKFSMKNTVDNVRLIFREVIKDA